MNRSKVEGWLGFVILGGIIVLALVLSLAGGGEERDSEDALASAKPNGRRALWLTLSELGLEPRRWAEAPDHLPHGHGVLWLSRVPTQNMPGTSSDPFMGKRGGVKRFGLHALDHYRDFVDRGGILMMRAGDGALDFLTDELGFEACRSVALENEPGGSGQAVRRDVRTSSGEDLRVSVTSGRHFLPLDPNETARELWSGTFGGMTRPFVVEVPQGAGSVVLLADDAFVRNDAIGENDNAIAAVRLVEDVLTDGELLLDEYELGSWTPPSLIAVALSPQLVLASLHIVACLALFVWMHAFARAFPRDPEALELFSPLLRARSLGGVLARGRRYDALGALLRRGVFARLARTVPGRLGSPRPEGATAADEADAKDTGAVRRVTSQEVAAFAKAAGLADRAQDLETVFVSIPVRTRDDLDVLDRKLGEIEAEIAARRAARVPAHSATDAPERALAGADTAAATDLASGTIGASPEENRNPR